MDELLAKVTRIIATIPDHALAAELVVDAVLLASKLDEREAAREGARLRKQRSRMSRVTSVTSQNVTVTSVTGSPLDPPPDLSSRILSSDPDPDQSNPDAKKPRRARQRLEYSEPFERAWSAYPRRDEKAKAYGEWKAAARAVTAESELLEHVLTALAWQVPLLWSGENWRYSPYFERYLKRRKWEDTKPLRASSRPTPPKPPPGGYCVGHANGANEGTAVTPVIQRDTCPECRRIEASLRSSWKKKEDPE